MTSVDRALRVRREGAPATALFLFGAILSLAAVGCRSERAGPETWTLAGRALGTSWSVKLVVPAGAPFDLRTRIESAVEAELALVDQAMSTWRDDSELEAWNRARTTEPSPISEELARVVEAALELADRSSGAFDPTVGPLVDAWGFGPGAPIVGPSAEPPADLDAVRGRIGWEKVELARTPDGSRTLAKRVPDLELDLSGIAKGYAVDRIASALADLGVEDHLSEVGGEVVARGRRADGTHWQVGIEKPSSGIRAVQRAFPLLEAALATSGDYRNYREVGGERLSHLLDPRTGRPIGHRLASASVVATTCMEADGWATALMVLGADRAREIALRDDLAVFLVLRSEDGGFEEVASPAFERLAAPSPHAPAGRPATETSP